MKRAEQLLQRLYLERQLGELDLQFARFLLSKAGQPSELLALASALVCRATTEGHVCLDLKSVDYQPLLQPGMELADLPQWRAALLASGVVGQPGDYQPLILDAQDRLYLQRYWDYEQRLAAGLLRRAYEQVAGVDRQQLAADLALLFPPQEQAAVDWQQIAAATAVLRPLSVISGGPGTGKTTTVTKILALLRRQPGGNELRIALAAPTGKAAARMQGAIRKAKSAAGIAVDSIPEQASTLHRLLGVRQGDSGFRHHRDNPLPVDVLILDEASMIDVALMTKLLEALPAASRLILLGDKDQLASVEAGAVLGDICNPCQGPGPVFAAELTELTGAASEELAGVTGPRFCDSIVVLRHSYRFAADSPIGRLATAVNRGDGKAACGLLEQDVNRTIQWIGTADIAEQAAEKYLELFRQVHAGAAVELLFHTLDRFRLLCALRQGPAGTEALNQAITLRLQHAGVPTTDEWYAGRPVMVTRNDHQLKLYNGDVGITLPDPARQGTLGVVFLGDDQALRWLAPARLPPHESVFAMTVHKSQGSEFDEVLLLLPDQDSPVLSRELLYTAITRARGRFTLAAAGTVFQAAVHRRLLRQSGLADLLSGRSFLTT